ncbi:hypothetical protein COCMIDRAFT_103490, partial [Bipolaris oryzae ATCC 44560]
PSTSQAGPCTRRPLTNAPWSADRRIKSSNDALHLSALKSGFEPWHWSSAPSTAISSLHVSLINPQAAPFISF